MTTLATRLADTAAGTFGEEAAVWLLDQHGHWLPELERCGLIREVPAQGWTATVISGGIGRGMGLIGTASEWQVLNIAMALYRDESTQFVSLTSLDSGNRLLALHAIAWAMGGRAYADGLGLLARDLECRGCGYDPRNEHMTGHHPRCPA